MDEFINISWSNDVNSYSLQNIIGKGAFSIVYQGLYNSKQSIAIKVIDLENINISFENISNEINIMRECIHENLLYCYNNFISNDKLYLITRFMDYGSCLHLLNYCKCLNTTNLDNGFGFNEDWLAYILREVIQGIVYLHSYKYIHRDIKPGNILVNSNGDIKLSDFGVSGWMFTHTKGVAKTFVGTLCYMAPEVMEQTVGYDLKADIWSLGITALELAKGYPPYYNLSPMKILIKTIEEDSPSLRCYPNDRQRTGAPFSNSFINFLNTCLIKNPKNRYTADELLKNKFFTNRSKNALIDQLLRITPNINNITDSSIGNQLDNSIIDNQIVKHEDNNYNINSVISSHIPIQSSNKSFQTSTIKKTNSYVPGTTWVFDDEQDSNKIDSQVNSATNIYLSKSNRIRLSIMKNQSSSRHSIVQLSIDNSDSNNNNNEITNNNKQFLDDFESDTATLKYNATTNQANNYINSNNDTKTFFDEFEDIIKSDNKQI